MSERVVRIGEGLVPFPGVKRAYPWTPFAQKYAEIVGERLHVRVTVEKFQLRVNVVRFYGMYNEDSRVSVYFPITAKKKWIVSTKPRTKVSEVVHRVVEVKAAMRRRDMERFERAMHDLFNYLETRFSRVIYEYNIQSLRGRGRMARYVGKATIRPHKGRL